MLLKLIVKNYAIIDFIEIDFSQQLNIITGETGAGKSILLGALSLALGDRADGRSLFDSNDKCVVEAHFSVAHYQLHHFFTENELDYEDTTIVRREIAINGKSRAFVNDTPVNLTVLKELGSQLVNLHSQHETLELSSSNFQLQLIDAVAKNDALQKTYSAVFQNYKAKQTELIRLKTLLANDTGDLDYLIYQFKELEDASIDDDDAEQLEQELRTLENAEEIKATLIKVNGLISDEQAAINLLSQASSILSQASKYSIDIEPLSVRLESVIIELQDLSNELFAIADNTVYDQERISILIERLNIINKLLAKHKLADVKSLLALKDSLHEKITGATNASNQIVQLQNELKLAESELLKSAHLLTESRKKVLTNIENEVAEKLAYVGMPSAKLVISTETLPLEKINITGQDKVKFLFTANKGRAPEELKNVASGGELSRLMLVLKSLIAANTALPTLIFDEIDSGISGEVAYKVGLVLEQLGNSHQVIAITHLPQIASKGTSHFYVHKALLNDKTVTRIKMLSKHERVGEIAKMLVGDKVTDAALASAKELLLN